MQSAEHATSRNATAQSIQTALNHLAHWLPSQAPLKDFVHHNTLHAYQDRPFHQATRVAAQMYGARRYLALSDYRQKYAQGEISQVALEQILVHRFSQPAALQLARTQMFEAPEPVQELGIAHSGLRSRWQTQHALDVSRFVHPVLFRLLSQYFDQGISVWRMPHVQDGLFESVRRLTQESWLPLKPFSSNVAQDLLQEGPLQACETVLNAFVGKPAHHLRYLTEMCLEHPGWSGMVHMIQTQPEGLLSRRNASLLDLCALELIAEYATVKHHLGNVPCLTQPHENPLDIVADSTCPPPNESQLAEELWQEAWERSYVNNVFATLAQVPTPQSEPAYQTQVFFCIDDRECSVRRHLEEVNPSIETYASAGFYGVDCVFQGAEDALPFKHCPVPVQPRHLIREVKKGNKKTGFARAHHFESGANTFFRGYLTTQTLGLWSAVRLAFSVFRPSLIPPELSSLRRVEPDFDLDIENANQSLHGYQVGYSPSEMADRVLGQLKSTGALAASLKDLIVFLGHGASSVNNPYFAAYDCGACSGKPGSPNARAFASMANRQDVRDILKERGVNIPSTTWFVGGLHDTTRDEAQFFDLDKLPPTHRQRFLQFERDMKTALGRNAQERCTKFEGIGVMPTAKHAHNEVRQRSVAIFEPRPELNHAGNAGCIVGRRSLTRGVSLDRRMFLNSYDPTTDLDGDILVNILAAVVPVCGGINLEYFFSRTDHLRYGSGTKLPHNINGLIGVANGVEGDLLTGLPTQMTELHPPLRLSLIVEQSPDVALHAAQKNPAVFEWIRNDWVKFFVITPTQHQTFEWVNGRLAEVQS